MSFGWSAGDIVSAINAFITIEKALRESGGSRSEYQAAITFLESVEKTLTGILYLIQDNPDLPREGSLLEQVNVVKSAIEGFKEKVEKYKKSLDAKSERGKLKAAPRAIQFALSDVKELQRDIERPQMVLNAFINLQTLLATLEISRTSKENLAGLQKLAKDLFQLLPTITDGVSILGEDIKSQLQDGRNRQQQSEISLKSHLNQVQSLLTNINALQISVDADNKAGTAIQKEWQEQLQLSLQNLVNFNKEQLELLLKIKMEPELVDPGADENFIPAVLVQVLLLIGNGIAGAFGGYIALKQGQESRRVHKEDFRTLSNQEFHAQFHPPRYLNYYLREMVLEKADFKALRATQTPFLTDRPEQYIGPVPRSTPAKDLDVFSHDIVQGSDLLVRKEVFDGPTRTDKLDQCTKSLPEFIYADKDHNASLDDIASIPNQSEISNIDNDKLREDLPIRRQLSPIERAKAQNMRKIGSCDHCRSKKICGHAREIVQRFSPGLIERCPTYHLPWEKLKGYLEAIFPELAFCEIEVEREAISQLREHNNENPQQEPLSTDGFEKSWKAAISSPKFRVGQVVWAKLGRLESHYMHIASERKHGSVSEGWTYQLTDHEGKIHEDGEWVSERLLSAA